MDLINKLEFLLALSRERHFGRAAALCRVTQPTLSAGLKQLEEELGVLLVQRSARFQGFTDDGDRVLEWARRLVNDARAMRQEITASREKLSGHLRIAAIPTALPMVPALTTPFRALYPNVNFTVLSRPSTEILHLLESLDVDAGLTYLGNEPVGRVSAVPLYQERYCLLTAPDAPLGDRQSVTWVEVGQLPLCLLTPDMQNRRIIDRLLADAGTSSSPTLESNSIIVLVAHVRTGKWASIMPVKLAITLGLAEKVRAIPIVGSDAMHTIGLVVAERERMTPITAAFVRQARLVAPGLRDDAE